MVNTAINWLFVDLNSYFASIEQELCLELRGQPIAILPIRIEAQTGCCIAVSAVAAYWSVYGYLCGLLRPSVYREPMPLH